MPGRTARPGKDALKTRIWTEISKIFDQAKTSNANHRKNFVALYKIQIEAAKHTEKVHNGRDVKLVGERVFQDRFAHSLFRALPHKKGTPEADRIIKFIGGYIRFAHEKAAEENAEDEESDSKEVASRFMAFVLKQLLPGFQAKDKNVRFRTLQTVAEMASHLGEIDEEIYDSLCAALLDRMQMDREAAIRVQATISIAKLCKAEDSSEAEEGEPLLEKLQDTPLYDSSAEVRRTALLGLPINDDTLPHILDGVRDTDDTTRKLVYNALLKTHPCILTVAQRELIVDKGLGDRVPAVQAAAASLIARWMEVVNIKTDEPHTESSGVLALLGLFDLTNGGIAAADALRSVFTTKETIFDNLEFGNNYWMNLTPETAFLARVFVDHCKATKDEVRLEAALPVVSALGCLIQDAFNRLLDDDDVDTEENLLGNANKPASTRREKERNDNKFVMAELLKIAVNLDYTDEVGRRGMFQFVRELLSWDALPQSLVASSLDVLRELSATERDFICVVVEVIQVLREDYDDEEELAPDNSAETSFGDTPATVKPARLPLFQRPREELSKRQKIRTDQIDLRCLSLCAAMLERVNIIFEENPILNDVLEELVFPSREREEAQFKEKSIICLGLCCLVARKQASSHIGGFLMNIPREEGAIKIALIKSVSDMLSSHDAALFKIESESENLKNLTNFLIGLLDENEDEKVLAQLCLGMAKLVLWGVITDQNVVQRLVEIYLSPHTASNQELRQSLSSALALYSYSSPKNQLTIVRIFIPVLLKLSEVRKGLDEDQDMVSSLQVSVLFLDWTDPFKLAKVANGKVEQGSLPNEGIQATLATKILEALFEVEADSTKRPNQACYGKIDKEEKKVLCQLLNKLHIPDKIDDDDIRRFKILISNLRERHPVRDATSKTAFNKFEAMIAKKFEKQLEGFDSEEFRKMESLQELFSFLDDIIPDDDDDEIVDIDLKKGRKRRSESFASTSTKQDADFPPSKNGKGEPKAKRRRLSADGEDEDDGSTQRGAPPFPVAPTRALPKQTAASKNPVIIEISSDEDEQHSAPLIRHPRTNGPRAKHRPKTHTAYRVSKKPEIIEISSDEDEQYSAPPIRHPRTSGSGAKIKVEREEEETASKIDADINKLLEDDASEVTLDSIMDPDSDEEEEDEVNDLLAEGDS